MIRFYNGKLLSLSGGFEISDWEVWVEESMIRRRPHRSLGPTWSSGK